MEAMSAHNSVAELADGSPCFCFFAPGICELLRATNLTVIRICTIEMHSSHQQLDLLTQQKEAGMVEGGGGGG